MKIKFTAYAPSGLVHSIREATEGRFDWSTIFTMGDKIFSLSPEHPVRTQRYTICIKELLRGDEASEEFQYDGWGRPGILGEIVEVNQCCIAEAVLMGQPLSPYAVRPTVDVGYHISIETNTEGSF